MLRCVAEARVVGKVVVAAQHDLESPAPMELSHRTCPAGEAVVDLGGELDILAALVRMARYAEQEGCPFRLASPNPSLVKIMRITGLDRRFLISQASALG
jgi:hypothetical protein